MNKIEKQVRNIFERNKEGNMRKTLIALATLGMLLQTGSLLAEDVPIHETDVQTIINIDAKMAEVEKRDL